VETLDVSAAAINSIRPATIDKYLDRVHLWLPDPLNSPALRRLETLSGGGGIYADRPTGHWQKLQLLQPKREGLRCLSTINSPVHLTYVEFSLDWTFNSQAECEQADRFVDCHHVKKWHGRQKVHYHKETRYTADPKALVKMATYGDLHNRMTGEAYCLHNDWRVRGGRALRACGVNSISDLLNLDYREFWRTRMLLYAADLQRLGRLYHNHTRRTRRRQLVDADAKAGAILFRSVGNAVQGLVDKFGSKFRVWDCLTRLDASHLLPVILALHFITIVSATSRTQTRNHLDQKKLSFAKTVQNHRIRQSPVLEAGAESHA
jgi:hypothetical protein